MSFGERSRPFWAAPLTKRYGMQKPLAREAVKAGEAAREAGRLEGFARQWQRDAWPSRIRLGRARRLRPENSRSGNFGFKTGRASLIFPYGIFSQTAERWTAPRRRILLGGRGSGMKRLILAILALAAVAVVAIVVRFLATHDFYGLSGGVIPSDRGEYAGARTAPNHILTIDASGNIHYERHEGGTNVTLDVPIRKFTGDDFLAGALFWTTTFHVTAPPHREGDVWRTTSDDGTYSRP
jgi:hypothetical protein